MFTLKDLIGYHLKRIVTLGIHLSLRSGKRDVKYITLNLHQIELLFQERLVMEEKVGRKLVQVNVARQGYLAVFVERRLANRRQWEKIKAQMREAQFSYRPCSAWFNSYENGEWLGCPFS